MSGSPGGLPGKVWQTTLKLAVLGGDQGGCTTTAVAPLLMKGINLQGLSHRAHFRHAAYRDRPFPRESTHMYCCTSMWPRCWYALVKLHRS
jgi:hypothetical protein